MDVEKIAGELESVRIASVRPEDTVVVTLNAKNLDDRTLTRLRDALQTMFPTNRVVVLEQGMTLEIVRPE